MLYVYRYIYSTVSFKMLRATIWLYLIFRLNFGIFSEIKKSSLEIFLQLSYLSTDSFFYTTPHSSHLSQGNSKNSFQHNRQRKKLKFVRQTHKQKQRATHIRREKRFWWLFVVPKWCVCMCVCSTPVAASVEQYNMCPAHNQRNGRDDNGQSANSPLPPGESWPCPKNGQLSAVSGWRGCDLGGGEKWLFGNVIYFEWVGVKLIWEVSLELYYDDFMIKGKWYLSGQDFVVIG